MEEEPANPNIQVQNDKFFEDELSQAPLSLNLWLEYIKSYENRPIHKKSEIYEKALKLLPGSYKLWFNYLKDWSNELKGKTIIDPIYDHVNNLYEKSLIFMNKMPRIWLNYLILLMQEKKITLTRRTFDRSLQSLPVTQHSRIWDLYLQFASKCGVERTAMVIHQRYLYFEPKHREYYIDYLLSINKINEACKEIIIMLNNDDYISYKNKTKHELWMDLAKLLSNNPNSIIDLPVDSILRNGITKYPQESGRLWCYLSLYYIGLGQIEKARDIYEEGIQSVITVRDFGMIFEAYVQFEDKIIRQLTGDGNEEGQENNESDSEYDEDDELIEYNITKDDLIDMELDRLELLMDRRPIMLSSAMLRQNPNNVDQWRKRTELFTDPKKKILCFTEAIKTIDPQQCTGKLHQLWIDFAKYYEENDDINNAIIIFTKASEVEFKQLDNLASIYCEWSEMYLRHELYNDAYQLIKECIRVPNVIHIHSKYEKKGKLKDKLYRSTKLWSLYCDLEESLGTLDSVCDAYNTMIDLKIANVQTILNYSDLLESKKYFERSFVVYEKGINMFQFPYSKPIWTNYLRKFMDRYGQSKLERTRDLFEQCLSNVPSNESKQFFLLYVELEEKYGLTRHMMSIFDRATSILPDNDKYEFFLLYINKAEQYYGITKTREIYEKAIELLQDNEAREMTLKYAEMETNLGEIERARHLYVHCSQFCNPKTLLSFWKKWENFESSHGNVDTYKEMLRIKRTVELSFIQ